MEYGAGQWIMVAVGACVFLVLLGHLLANKTPADLPLPVHRPPNYVLVVSPSESLDLGVRDDDPTNT